MKKIMAIVSMIMALNSFAEVPHIVPSEGCTGNTCCPQKIYCDYYLGCGDTSGWQLKSDSMQFESVKEFQFNQAFIQDGNKLECKYMLPSIGNNYYISLIKYGNYLVINVTGNTWRYGFMKTYAQCFESMAAQCGVNYGN